MLNENLEQEVQRQLDVIMRERLRYERELISAKEKAEESARFKSIIMSNMSHELRTPLTAILGFGQILTEELNHEHQEFLVYMNRNANRLLQTLDAILELSALQAGSLDLRVTDIDVELIARQVCSEYSDAAVAKGLSLIIEKESGPAFGEGDPEALKRALRKIVENAIKFTPAGEVRLAYGTEDRNTYVRVRDTGIGISPNFLPQVFEAFKQESDGFSRTHEGTGIGLTVAQLFINAMNGRIEVQSVPDRGSCFSVYLKESRSVRVAA
jgi:signal transduction histidine kinase